MFFNITKTLWYKRVTMQQQFYVISTLGFTAGQNKRTPFKYSELVKRKQKRVNRFRRNTLRNPITAKVLKSTN